MFISIQINVAKTKKKRRQENRSDRMNVIKFIDSHSLQENTKSAILNDTISVMLTSQGTIKCGARFVFSLRSSTGYPRKIKGVPRLQITAVNKCKELTCTFHPSMMFHNPVLPLIFS